MNCAQAKGLFGAYWDDDATRAEREWLEGHLASCHKCRNEYEEFARTLEWTAALPRVEPAPDLIERALMRARRSTPATDVLPAPRVAWVPVTAAAALLFTLGTLVSPWIGIGPRQRVATGPEVTVVREPVLVEPAPGPKPGAQAPAPVATPGSLVAANGAIPDSVFDHSDDVEFVLDPVTVRRGRASVTRPPVGAQGEQAVISF